MEYNPLPPMIPTVAIADGFARVLFLSDFFDVAISPLLLWACSQCDAKPNLSGQAVLDAADGAAEVVPDTAASISLA
jgi:hypothetical protein